MTNYIWITCEKEGLHNWPDADDDVVYLKHRHWHIFKFKIYIEVLHNDREIEFHRFRKYVYNSYIKRWPLNLRNKSCEMMADNIHEYIVKKYPNRRVIIETSEDGNNGVVKTYSRNQQI